MAGNYICDVKHPDLGVVKVYEMTNASRCYAIHSKIGQIPFQNKEAQAQLRGLVIGAGFGDSLLKKPTLLEVANHAPEDGEEVGRPLEQVNDEVVAEVKGASLERVLPKKKQQRIKVGLFSRGSL